MDIGSLLGTIFGTTVNYKRDRYVHCSGSLHKPKIDSGSYVAPRNLRRHTATTANAYNPSFQRSTQPSFGGSKGLGYGVQGYKESEGWKYRL